MFSRWARTIVERLFVTTDDGIKVYFPYGPQWGYVIPRKEYESVICSAYIWSCLFTFVSLLVTFIISFQFNLSYDMLFAISLLDYIDYYRRAQRITRKLALLPQALSMKIIAHEHGFQEIEVQKERSKAFCIISVLIAVVFSDHGILMPIACAILGAYQAIVCRKVLQTLKTDQAEKHPVSL